MAATRIDYLSRNNEAPNYLTSLFQMLSQNTFRELLKLPLLKNSSDQGSFSPIEEHYCGTILVLVPIMCEPEINSKLHAKLANNLSVNFIISILFSCFSTVCNFYCNAYFTMTVIRLFNLILFYRVVYKSVFSCILFPG